MPVRTLIRITLTYGLCLAAVAFFLQWIQYQHNVRLFATEIYILLIATVFTALGLWAGNRLTRKSATGPFTRNDCAIQSLGISQREFEVLELIAAGHTNKEISARLFVSVNTTKTHTRHLYEKLEVSRRTQAVEKARKLNLIP